MKGWIILVYLENSVVLDKAVFAGAFTDKLVLLVRHFVFQDEFDSAVFFDSDSDCDCFRKSR